MRVWAPSVGIEGSVGTLQTLKSDTIVVNNDEPLVLAIGSLTRLEVSRNRTSKAGTGFIVGFLGGAAIGAVIGLATVEDSGETFDVDFPETFDSDYADELGHVAGLALAGGLVGGSVGALIGWTIKVDRWMKIPIHQLHVSASPVTSDGAALSVSLYLGS